MEGRKERERKLDERLVTWLASQPKWMSDFYYWLSGDTTATTRKVYLGNVARFVKFCEEEWGKSPLQEEDFKKADYDLLNKYMYKLRREKGEAAVNANVSTVSTFFKFLITKRVVDTNPCIGGIRRPSVPEKSGVVYLERDEVKKVERALASGIGSDYARQRQEKWKHRDQLLFDLPLYLGLRVSALLDINVEDIDLKNRKLYVTEKRNKNREFRLSDTLVEELKKWLDEREQLLSEYAQRESALFLVVYGGKLQRMSYAGANRIIKKYTQCVDKHISPHKLRATLATLAYEETGDLYKVSKTLGHESPQTTARYYVNDQNKSQETVLEAMENVYK